MLGAVVTVAVEGDLDAAVALRLIREAALLPGPIYGRSGKHRLDKSLRGFNNAARHAPWLVLRDLDHDAACAPELVAQLLGHPSAQMCFRVAVRQIEAWLLGDQKRLAELLQVPATQMPADPEGLEDAKGALVSSPSGAATGLSGRRWCRLPDPARGSDPATP